MAKIEKLTERDALYNEVLKTVKKHGAGMQIGLVRAVLGEVDGEIALRAGRNSFDTVLENLKEREP